MLEKIEKQLISKILTLPNIDKIWCDSLLIEDEKISKISISVDVNDFNYIKTINIHFIAKNPSNFIFTGKISVNEFDTKLELEQLIKKQARLANLAITDAIRRAAQIDMFV